MRKTELITKILTLGVDLDLSEGIESVNVVDNMERAIDTYVKELNPMEADACKHVWVAEADHLECTSCGRVRECN
jgi:hypothetical protein